MTALPSTDDSRRVLRYIEEHPCCTRREVIIATGLAEPSVASLLVRLRAAGYIDLAPTKRRPLYSHYKPHVPVNIWIALPEVGA